MKPISHVYFPEPGVVSVVARTLAGERLEAGVIGPEGMTGLAIIHGIERAPNEIFVQIPCRAWRIETDRFAAAIAQSPSLLSYMLRFAHVFSVQVSQTVICNGRFTIDERLARWLLMCHDRSDREDLPLTHEFVSLMLGIRRSGATMGLQRLIKAGGVTAKRGIIGIRDRDVLIEAAGDTYGLPEVEYERVMKRG
ncbi:Crp/Fnr family transcriptional regulator [Methylobacterium sp. 77]|uniref:Crp/Fnr family transcriptional regulator n=1 Tax=Methylobacterium sp. 77 TaxID=1101192 RepID=UPI00035F9DBB|nr:Crp/Fnr family transcriptional regulator [Methylobacterium sp. 77]